MKESHKQVLKIEDSWHPEISIRETERLVVVDLCCYDTGEIRQTVISFDALARKVFASHIKTNKNRYTNIKLVANK